MADHPIKTCILSHGRSGTLYTAKVLQAIGLDFGHEQDGEHGAIGGIFFRGKRDLDGYGNIFHQVRHPLAVIASATTCRMTSFQQMFTEIGIEGISEADPLRRAMLSWKLYTDWAQQHASWTYRIEDFPTVWPELLAKMNVPYVALPDIPTDTNARSHRHYSWDDLYQKDPDLSVLISESAGRFGYA